jgi:hypothetical protein
MRYFACKVPELEIMSDFGSNPNTNQSKLATQNTRRVSQNGRNRNKKSIVTRFRYYIAQNERNLTSRVIDFLKYQRKLSPLTIGVIICMITLIVCWLFPMVASILITNPLWGWTSGHLVSFVLAGNAKVHVFFHLVEVYPVQRSAKLAINVGWLLFRNFYLCGSQFI